MNKPLAVNQFKMDRKLFYEGMRKLNKELFGKSSLIAIIIMTVVWIALAVATILLSQSPFFIFLEFAVIFVAAFWLTVLYPRHKAKKAWNGMVERYGEEHERRIDVFSDRMEIHASDMFTTVYLKDIDRVVLSDDLIILTTSKKTGIMLLRDGFIDGNEAETLNLFHSFAQK